MTKRIKLPKELNVPVGTILTESKKGYYSLRIPIGKLQFAELVISEDAVNYLNHVEVEPSWRN